MLMGPRLWDLGSFSHPWDNDEGVYLSTARAIDRVPGYKEWLCEHYRPVVVIDKHRIVYIKK
jgi:hypothetical protein